MSKKQNKNIITQDIQVKANVIINEGEKTSLEDKRIKFQNYVENYYNNFTGASDVLVSRLNDIDFYTSTSKDLITSAIVGIITSTIVSILFNLDNDLDKMSGIIGKLLSGIIIFIFLLWLLNLLMKKFEERKTLNNYEKLHCEEFEKEIIERILDKRLKQAEETISEKN